MDNFKRFFFFSTGHNCNSNLRTVKHYRTDNVAAAAVFTVLEGTRLIYIGRNTETTGRHRRASLRVFSISSVLGSHAAVLN